MKRITSKIFVIAAVLTAAITLLSVPAAAEDEAGSDHAHVWEEKSTAAATCTVDGYSVMVCSICGEDKIVITEKATHSYVSVSNVEATCTEDGERIIRCEVCGAEVRNVDPAKGHDWDEGEVEVKPTLFGRGTMKYTCRRDPSHVRYEDIPSELSSSDDALIKVFLTAAAVVLSFAGASVLMMKKSRRNSNK